MKHDVSVSWKQHLKNGNVWRIVVELPIQDGPDDNPTYYSAAVDVVAPNRDLAGYIVTTMYPDYDSLSIQDYPLTLEEYGKTL